MTKLKLAVIGTGMAWERLHLPAIRELSDKYEVVALADPDKNALTNAANNIGLSHDNIYTNYDDMLKRDDIDVVNVAVPIEYNYLVAKDVLLAGKNLISEKPLAPDLQQGTEFVKLQKEKNVQVMIAENYRYNEEHNIIKHLVEEKRIGDVLFFIKNNMNNFEESMKQNTFAAKEWRQYPMFEGGIILDSAVHDIAGLRYIFGELDSVSAFGKKHNKTYSPYSNLNCNLQYKSGIVGHYIYCDTIKEVQKPAIGLRIIGTNGIIYLEDRNCGIINVFYNDGSHEMINFTPQKGYYYEFENFYYTLTKNESLQVTPFLELGDAKIIFALLKSAQEQKVIKIDPTNTFITRYMKSEKVLTTH